MVRVGFCLHSPGSWRDSRHRVGTMRRHFCPIFYRLRHVPVDDFPEYEAVSYTWGSEKPVCKIRVDEGGFWVAPNLEAALVQFRARAIRPLWIDAICL